jgi:hypothetical protein
MTSYSICEYSPEQNLDYSKNSLETLENLAIKTEHFPPRRKIMPTRWWGKFGLAIPYEGVSLISSVR